MQSNRGSIRIFFGKYLFEISSLETSKEYKTLKELDGFLNELSDPIILKIANRIPSNSHVADLGCGCGTTTFKLSNILGESATITGLDFSKRI